MTIGPLSRRQLLAGGLGVGIAASAGCLGLGTETASEAATTELTLTLDRLDGSLRQTYVDQPDDHDPNWDDEALAAVLDDESYTTQYRKPFFAEPDDPAYVLADGTYYQLGSVIVDEVSETYPVLRLFAAEDPPTTPVDGSDDGALPEEDKRAVQIAHMAARARGNEGGFPEGLVQRGGYVYRNDTARDTSRLLADDGPDYVSYRDTTYAVEVTDEAFHEAVYRPTAEPVAQDPDTMEAILRARYVGARVSERELSADAQQIIAQADASEYSETHPFSDAFTELLRAFHHRAFIDGNIRKDAGVRTSGDELIRYGDAYYEQTLQLRETQAE